MTDPLTINRYNNPKNQRIVYHNNGGTPDNKTYLAALLTSLGNHIQALVGDGAEIEQINSFTLHVVSHGAGVDLFDTVQNDDRLKQRFDMLQKRGVRFLVCANTLRARNLDWKTLYGVSEHDIVPSGVAELAWLQAQGFAYIHL